MNVWTWEITIDGQTITNALNSVEVIKGANNPLDQSSPATAALTLQGLPTVNGMVESPEWYVGKPLEIGVRKVGEAQSNRVFYGQILSQTTIPLDAQGLDVVTDISAQSYMARLDQIMVPQDALPAQTEYERIYSFMERQQSPTWDGLPSAMTWADIPTLYEADIRWSEWLFPETVYTPLLLVPNWSPGDPDPSVALEAWVDGEVSMLSHAMELAMGVGGFIYEQDQLIAPQIWYLSRADFDSAPPATLNVGNAALGFSLSNSNGLWDIYSEAIVSNQTQAASDINFDAMQTYGVRTLDLVSYASNLLDLQTIATTKVSALSRPIPDLERLTLDYAQLTFAQRIWDVGAMRTLSGIPAAFGGSQQYQIRGLTFRGSAERVEVDWLLLSRRTLFPGPMWRNIGPAVTWNDLTTTWQDWIN